MPTSLYIDVLCFTDFKQEVLTMLKVLTDEANHSRKLHHQTHFLLRKIAKKEDLNTSDFDDNAIARLVPCTCEREVIELNAKLESDPNLLEAMVRNRPEYAHYRA